MDPYRNLVSQSYQAYQADALFRPHADFAFERLEKIGAGGMGSIYRVLDRRAQRQAALKVLDKPEAHPHRVQRFFREARVTALLDHPAIPPVYEFGRSGNGEHYILMKLIRGRTLREELRELHSATRSGEASARQELLGFLTCLIRVCEALDYAHARGVLHRDLKPDNIMLGKHGQVYLMDWGIARDLNEKAEQDRDFCQSVSRMDGSLFEAQLSGPQGIVGTFGYMAPEQARGEELDGRADVFAFGAILYELLTAEPPFSSPGVSGYIAASKGEVTFPQDFGAGFPNALARLARDCLAPEREDRPADPAALAARLTRILERRPRTTRKSRALPLSLGLGLGLILGAIPAAIFARGSAPAAPPPPITDPSEDARRALERGRLRLSEGQAENAIAALDEALKTLPEQEEALLLRARARLALGGRRAAARQDLDALLRAAGPRLAEAAYQRALLELEVGAEARAEADLDRAIALEPEHRAARLARARLLEELGRLREALPDLDRAIALAPNETEAYVARGALRLKMRRPTARERAALLDAAREDLNRAIQLDLEYAEAYFYRANLFVRCGEEIAAHANFTRAIDLKPDYHQAYNNRGSVLVSAGQLEDAARDFSEAIRLAPERALPYFNRANVRAKLGKREEALRDFDAAIERDQSNAAAYANRGGVLEGLGRLKEAARDYRQALGLDPALAGAARARLSAIEARLKEGS